MSKLIVSVEKIKEITPIEKADKIVLATVKGWNVIIQKGNHEVGELIVYFPPDCIIPEDLIEKYNLEFLRKGNRLKTIKLRGVFSEGLILPLECLPDNKKYSVGDNVADILGVKKWEPPANPSNNPHNRGFTPTKKKANPFFDKYTDINNIKNYNLLFNENDDVIITEKIHGSNFRAGKLVRYKGNLLGKIKSFLFGKYEFVYGSHNVQKISGNKNKGYYGEDVYGQMAKKYDLANKTPNDLIFYGEVYGNKIQELNYGLKDEIDLIIFDIKDAKTNTYLNWDDVIVICEELNLKTVPVLYKGKYSKEVLDKCTTGDSVLSKEKQIREGCVVKPLIESNDCRIGRKILKSISCDYLITKNRTEYH